MEDHDHREEGGRKPLDGLRTTFSPAVERAITEPSKYERPRDVVVWLLWIIDEDAAYSGIPQLKAICTTEYSIRYHVGMLLEQNDNRESLKDQPRSEAWFLNERTRFHIERSPCDHFFGSSLLADAQRWQLFTPPISVGKARKFEFGGD